MAEIDDHMAAASTGFYPDPGDSPTDAARAGFFASLGLLGTGGLPGAAAAYTGGLGKFGTRTTED